MILRLGEKEPAPGLGERCSGCDRPTRPKEPLQALRTVEGDLFGWFCRDCIRQWLAIRTAILWGCCARCGRKRTLYITNTGDPDGPEWLCADCRKVIQLGATNG